MPKTFQYLSNRRKNQLILRELNYYSHCNLSESYKILNVINDTKISLENINNVSSEISKVLNNTLSDDFDEINDVSTELHCDTESTIEMQNNVFEVNDTSDSSLYDESSLQNESSLQDQCSLQEDIKRLIVERNIPHNTANELLAILRKHGHAELSNDVTVLLQTPRNASVNIIPMCGGRYIHFGLSSGLKRSIQIYSKFIKGNEIKLNINIDGLPIAKSSGSQFWPIMASIENIMIYTLPFVIGIYHGMHKPDNANAFIQNFVNEFILLSQTGIIVSDKRYAITLNAILCDTPARLFITYTKGYTGYFSCSRCTQEGDFIRNRVAFTETLNSLRTDDTFRNKSQIEHHTGDSILERLSIDMVSQIPLDYMHLVCLGVVKRLLLLWIRGHQNIRLSTENVKSISHHLISIKSSITSEFARKPRTLDDIDKWKATEFRQFLLYTGIVVMKSVLSPMYYNHFLALSIAIRILIDEQQCIKYNVYANSLLSWFVSNFGNIYGKEYISYNVHNLLHLANDVQRFGSLDNFSCFKFENHMQKLKKKIHQSGVPLEEISNRLHEESQLPIVSHAIEQYPVVVYKKNSEISHLQYKTFKIAENDIDNCALLSDNSLVFIVKILEENNVLYIRAQCFSNPGSVFATPCCSKTLGIFLISNTTDSHVITVPVTQIKRKCVKIKNLHKEGSYVTIPMLLNNN